MALAPEAAHDRSDPSVIVGAPLWSPASDWIVYIKTRAGQSSHWLIKSDGSDHHQLTDRGICCVMVARWPVGVLHRISPGASSCVYKVPVEGGDRVLVRCDAGCPRSRVTGPPSTTGAADPAGLSAVNEIFKASPPDGEGLRLHRYANSRMPWYPTGNTLSPDDRWIALPLKDGATTNVWTIPPTAVRCARSPISAARHHDCPERQLVERQPVASTRPSRRWTRTSCFWRGSAPRLTVFIAFSRLWN